MDPCPHRCPPPFPAPWEGGGTLAWIRTLAWSQTQASLSLVLGLGAPIWKPKTGRNQPRGSPEAKITAWHSWDCSSCPLSAPTPQLLDLKRDSTSLGTCLSPGYVFLLKATRNPETPASPQHRTTWLLPSRTLESRRGNEVNPQVLAHSFIQSILPPTSIY